jgi:hypothetical protein
MGTKELGWSAARFSAVRFLALTLSVSTVALALPARTAHAVDQKKARDKIVDFNKQALLSYEAKDFETAKDLLTKALKEAKQAGLEDDKMTARTYSALGRRLLGRLPGPGGGAAELRPGQEDSSRHPAHAFHRDRRPEVGFRSGRGRARTRAHAREDSDTGSFPAAPGSDCPRRGFPATTAASPICR